MNVSGSRSRGRNVPRMQKPTVGRIVHFHASPGSAPEAAIIIHVWSDTCVNLSVCNSGGTWRTQSSVLEQSNNPASSHWAWPPRS